MPEILKSVPLSITRIEVVKGADGDDVLHLEAIGADETPDVDHEIFDYASSKKYIEAWSERAAESTKAAGQEINYGNVRAQHGEDGSAQAAAKFCKPLDFDDKERQIRTHVEVVDADAIRKCLKGIYRGLSIKGRLVGKKWRDGEYYRYTVDPTEFSLVDNPANPNATITVIKADGSEEVLKVADGKTKRVGGKDLPASAFAYVGDKDKTDTWKLPIHDASHVRNALARLNQTEGIPEGEKDKVKKKILRAAKRFDIDAKSLDEKETAAKAARILEIAKEGGWAGTGMSTIAQLGYILDSLFYLRDTTLFEAEIEGDESTIPARLSELLQTAAEILEDMTSEEVKELIAMTETAKKAAEPTEVEKAAKSHFEKAKAAHGKMKEHLDEMGDHLSGACKCAGIGKCAEKMAGLHEKIKAAHESMGKHFDGDGDEAEKAAKAAKDAEAVAKAAAAKKDDEPVTLGKLSEMIAAEVGKAFAGAKEEIEKAAKAAGRPVPVLAGAKVVTKEDDQGGKDKDIIEKRAEVKADDPHRVSKLAAIDRAAEPELVKI